MVSFYPGPSKVHRDIPNWVHKAYQLGILEVNHRSSYFVELMRNTVSLLHEKLAIPSEYQCYFTSSATEGWEIVAQSLVQESSAHIYNGAFGEKWCQYTAKLIPHTHAIEFDLNLDLLDADLNLPQCDLIALTHTETSNGTFIGNSTLKELRANYSQSLIAVDATSSMGGADLNWHSADIWLASVQKCFGLPAGLGVLVCSPRAVERAQQLANDHWYNSLIKLHHYGTKHQTSYTPNVLHIFLLHELLASRQHITDIANKLAVQMEDWLQFTSNLQHVQPLVSNNQVQSSTVLTLSGAPSWIKRVIDHSLKQGFYLGLGYGSLKEHSLRIANFPEHTQQEIEDLQRLLLMGQF